MIRCASDNFKKWSTFVGVFLFTPCLGPAAYWSNIAVYIDSYSYASSQADTPDVHAPWVTSFLNVGAVLGLLVSARLTEMVGKRLTLVIAISVIAGALAGCFAAIRVSILAVNIIYGIVLAFGVYVLDGVVMLYVLDWSKDNVGKMMALMRGGIPIGGTIINQIVTRYVNAENFAPDVNFGPLEVFSQDSLIDKVPSSFLVMGAVLVGASVVGLFLVHENKESKQMKERLNDEEERAGHDEEIGIETNVNGFGGTEDMEAEGKCIEANGESTNNKSCDEGNGTNRDNSISGMLGKNAETTPMQAIRRYSLYLLSMFTLIGDFSYILMSNYYKEYSLLYIPDDLFITSTSMLSSVVISVSRFLLGIMLDKFSLKTSYVMYFTGCALATLTFYFLPMVNEWTYTLSIVMFVSAANPVHLFTAYSVVKVYGRSNYLFIYALVLVPSTICDFAIPLVFQHLLISCGWFYLFVTCSGLCALGLVLASTTTAF